MLEPSLATIVILVVGFLLLVAVPLLDGSKRFSKYVSLRYTLVATMVTMAFGCILDFSHLADQSRDIILMGGVILVGIFIVVRSLEKMKLGNKVIEVSAEHRGTRIDAKLHSKDKPEETTTAKEEQKPEEDVKE